MKRDLGARLVVAVAAVAAAAGVAAVTASVLSNLRHPFGRRPRAETERERVRRALAPLLIDLDPRIWGEWLQPLPDDFDFEAFRRSMPVLDPPLSSTIIEERESNPY
ncbi:MAG: hypothetical protein ACYDEB_01710 [Dehalococcoidia bacterium]